MQFSEFELDERLLRGVADMDFVEATPIQADAIPPALAGRDVLGAAMTGSGKTAAYVLPMLNRLLTQERGTTRALVLTPTRELAQQVDQHLAAMAARTDMTSIVIHGGVAYEPQERAFRDGVDVVIATPGRLLDHLRRPYANLDAVEVLVLDEADRMLDMGFIPDIRRILRQLPAERQTLLFSATMPGPIVSLSREMLSDPATINIERKAMPATGITQVVYPVRHDRKPALFLHLLEHGGIENALGFVRTRERADLVAAYLKSHGISVASIHGDRSQIQRTRALNAFKKGTYQVLVATDVAARGLDLVDLTHVVNIDVPAQPEDYIHRVGRTARYEATGDAITFVAARELADLHLIEKVIGSKLPRKYAEGFDYSRSTGPVTQPTEPSPTRTEEEESRPRRARSRSRRQEDADEMETVPPADEMEEQQQPDPEPQEATAPAAAPQEAQEAPEQPEEPKRASRSRRSRSPSRRSASSKEPKKTESKEVEAVAEEKSEKTGRGRGSGGRKRGGSTGKPAAGVRPWWESPTRETEGAASEDGGAVSVTETISAAADDEAFDLSDSDLEGFDLEPFAADIDRGDRGERSRRRGSRGRGSDRSQSAEGARGSKPASRRSAGGASGGRGRGGRKAADSAASTSPSANGVVARFVELREARTADRLSAGRPPWPDEYEAAAPEPGRAAGHKPATKEAERSSPPPAGRDRGGTGRRARGRKSEPPVRGSGRRAAEATEATGAGEAAGGAATGSSSNGVVARFSELRGKRSGDRLVGAIPLEMIDDGGGSGSARGRSRRGGRGRGGGRPRSRGR